MKKTAAKQKPRRKKAKATTTTSLKRPVWTIPLKRNGEEEAPPMHPQLSAQLAKPFLSTIGLSGESFQYPVAGHDKPHILGGLHKRMASKFFHGQSLDDLKQYTPGPSPLRLRSSKEIGSRADAALEQSIATGVAPVAHTKRGCSEYAAAIWAHWQSIGHRPVLAQLPVVLVKANIATAGDYFTISPTGKLCLWELKTGWPSMPSKKKLDIMAAPLEHVWLTPWNKWQLQVMITRMAYERELGMVIDGGARVIHAWKERRLGHTDYAMHVRVRDKYDTDLDPPNWNEYTDENAIYAAL